MPKKTLWFVAIAAAGLVYVVWDVGRVPARVTVMNQAGSSVRDIVITTDRASIAVGTLRSGESRAFPVEATESLELTYRWGEEERRWRSIEAIGPGQPLILYVTTAGRIEERRRLDPLQR